MRKFSNSTLKSTFFDIFFVQLSCRGVESYYDSKKSAYRGKQESEKEQDGDYMNL